MFRDGQAKNFVYYLQMYNEKNGNWEEKFVLSISNFTDHLRAQQSSKLVSFANHLNT